MSNDGFSEQQPLLFLETIRIDYAYKVYTPTFFSSILLDFVGFLGGFVSFVLLDANYRCNKLSPDAYLNTISISKEAKIERY